MDARQLQSVIVVIEKGSLGRAAATLNVSQPALTKSIQRLEERLGVPLFTRDSKGMRPTLYGEALRPHAHAILAGAEQAIREIEAMKSGARGTVSIAAGPLMSSEILSKATLRLLTEQPQIHVKIHTAIGNHMPGLLSGQYDFILAPLPLAAPAKGLIQRELVYDRIAVIARPGHALAGRARVKARDLLTFKWVLPEAGHNHRLRLSRVFDAEGLAMPEPDVECSSTEFIKAVVRGSNHLGLITQMGAKTESRSRTIEIALESPFMVRGIGMVWRQNQVLSRSSQLFMAAIEAACRKEKITPHARSTAKREQSTR